MVEAVLGGGGLGEVAELAAEAAGAPVAIMVPRLDAAVARRAARADLAALRRYVPSAAAAGRCPCRRAWPPRRRSRRAARWSAACCCSATRPSPDARRVPADRRAGRAHRGRGQGGRAEVERTVRDQFFEELRSRRPPGARGDRPPRRAAGLRPAPRRGGAVRRAHHGAPAPRGRAVSGEYAGVLAHCLEAAGGRAVRARAGRRRARGDASRARARGRRLRRHGTVGALELLRRPGRARPRAREAELVLDVLRRGEVPVGEDLGSGAYRLLFRVFASHPDEVRSFYEDTVAPLVRYDEPTAPSSSPRWRRSSSTTARPAPRPARSTCTGTRSPTGSSA